MTYDDLIARVAKLEHSLRRASNKISWLAQYHCEGNSYAKTQCEKLSKELWDAQSTSPTSTTTHES